MTDTERSRIHWLLGYLKGAFTGISAMCATQKHGTVTAEAVAEIGRYIVELTELVGRMEVDE